MKKSCPNFLPKRAFPDTLKVINGMKSYPVSLEISGPLSPN